MPVKGLTVRGMIVFTINYKYLLKSVVSMNTGTCMYSVNRFAMTHAIVLSTLCNSVNSVCYGTYMYTVNLNMQTSN